VIPVFEKQGHGRQAGEAADKGAIVPQTGGMGLKSSALKIIKNIQEYLKYRIHPIPPEKRIL
jgi:hypothetical protein